MVSAPALRLLFATDFSTACVDAGRAIAPLAEAGRLDVTTVHLVAPGASVIRARHALDAFLRRTGGLRHSARTVREAVDGPASLATIAERQPVDLILSPSYGGRGLRRILASSFRAQLLTRTSVPLLTAGSEPGLSRLGHRVRQVACLVHWDHAVAARVRTAAAFATYAGARLHLIDVLPAVDDGTVAYALHTDRPLSTTVSIRRMENLASAYPEAVVHAAVGPYSRELHRLVQASGADVLFAAGEQGRSGIVRHRVARHLDRLPCPVIYLGAGAEAGRSWTFERQALVSGQVTWAAERFDARRRAAS